MCLFLVRWPTLIIYDIHNFLCVTAQRLSPPNLKSSTISSFFPPTRAQSPYSSAVTKKGQQEIRFTRSKGGLNYLIEIELVLSHASVSIQRRGDHSNEVKEFSFIKMFSQPFSKFWFISCHNINMFFLLLS